MNAQSILELLTLESRLDELSTLLNHDEVAGGGAKLIEERMQELQEAIDDMTSETEPRTLHEIVESILKNGVAKLPN